jgi:hypothetical protein
VNRAEAIRPSGAATWNVCSGSIEMRSMFPDAPDEADSEVTEDGTACHWLAAETWENRFQSEGTLAPNGRVLTDEMFDAVDMYHGVLRSWPGVVAVCEKYVPIPRILQGFGGTPDAWAYNPDTCTLYIADLKFGFRFVEVWDNLQLICYACGIMDALRLDWARTNIVFTIVQPRARHKDGPVRVWKTTGDAILPHVTMLALAATRATQYVPNPGCTDCPGRHICVAYQNAALRAVEISYGGGNTHELNPPALGAELRLLKDAAKKLEGRISGLEVQAESLLRKGTPVPGWTLSATYARETWREGSEAELLTLAEKYFGGVTITKPAKLVTPNQARQVLPKDIVAMYAHKPSTGVRLTKADPYAAHKAFDK